MGLAASTFRLMYLTAFRFDLETKVQLITEAKLSLTSSISNLIQMGTDMDPESTEAKQLSARKERLSLMEKKLDMQMELYNTQLNAINKEVDSCKEMQKSNIERSFTYGSNR